MSANYVLHSAATLKPITVGDCATALNITNTDDYDYLSTLIDRAIDYYEKRTARQLLTATWKLYLDTFPDEIELARPPIASVTSITYVDQDGTTQTLSASNYQTDIVNPNSPGRIAPAYGMVWPSVRGETYNAVCVTFTAGWTTAAAVPATIKQALTAIVGHWFENREPVNIGNITTALPMHLDALLAIDDWGPSP